MTFISIETELTTAFTDLLLAIIAVTAVVRLLKTRDNYAVPQKAGIWAAAFATLAVAGMLGFWAHGFEMSEEFNALLWHPLYLGLGLTVSFFAAAVMVDLRGQPAPMWLITAFAAVGVGFYGITTVVPGSFLVFIAYEAVAMLFALGVYGYLSLRERRPTFYLMTMGVALSVLAAVFQAIDTVGFTLIWEFDNNGVFHLVQMAGLVFLMRGLELSKKSRA
ncbi:MAG: DUF6962 family protein [Spirochaetota bacterium]